MAEIEQLGGGQNPPEDQDWLLIEQGAAGGFYVTYCIGTAKAAINGRSDALATAKAAFILARQWAEEKGIATIFSKGVKDA